MAVPFTKKWYIERKIRKIELLLEEAQYQARAAEGRYAGAKWRVAAYKLWSTEEYQARYEYLREKQKSSPGQSFIDSCIRSRDYEGAARLGLCRAYFIADLRSRFPRIQQALPYDPDPEAYEYYARNPRFAAVRAAEELARTLAALKDKEGEVTDLKAWLEREKGAQLKFA